MPADAVHQTFVHWIRRIFKAGFHCTRSIVEQAKTQFGIDHPSVCFNDPQSSEAASFLELLFYPDRRIRLAYEMVWGHHDFSADMRDQIVAALIREPLAATVYMADEERPTCLPEVPAHVSEAFVHRLNIIWSPAPALRRAVEASFAPWHRHEILSRLRQARLAWHTDQTEAVARYIASYPVDKSSFEADLSFFLTILAELKAGQTCYDFLAAKRSFFAEALRKAEAFEEVRRSQAMETLILRGDRSGHGHADQWRAWIEMVDRISDRLFGCVARPPQPMERPLTVRDGPDDATIRRIVDFLSGQ